MPRITDELFSKETVKLEQDVLVHLLKIEVPAVGVYPATTLYIVDNNEDITFRGTLYTAFPFQFSNGFTHSSDGSIDKTTLSCANPERLFMYYVNNYEGLKGTYVTVYTTYKSFVTDGNFSCLTDYFIVDSYSATDSVLNLELDPSVYFERKLPRGAFYTNCCRFKYKDPNTCKYDGPLTFCKKTLKDCTAHTTLVFQEGTLTKGRDIYGNTVFWGPSFPLGVKPGYVLKIGSEYYTIKTFSSVIKVYIYDPVTKLITTNTASVNNALVVGDTISGDVVNITYQLLKGNQKNFGGFPGVPSTTKVMVL